MANGAFKFKDNSGNVVSFISGSGSDIVISGGTLNLSGMTGLTLGNVTMSGTTQNATSASHAASYLLTSSFNSYTGTTNTIIGSLQTSTGSLNTFTSSTDGRLNNIETSTGSLNSYTSSTNTRLGVIESTTSSLNTYTSSTDTRLGIIEGTTSSLNTFTSSASGRLNSIEGKTGSYATTGSNTFNGNLTVTGYIDAQELRTTYISSSILYRSGSTKFGDELTDTHAFTGSVLISGSLSVSGSLLTSGSSVGIGGQATPLRTLHVMGQGAFDMTHAGVVIQDSITPMTSSQIVSYKQTNAVGSAYRNMHLRADVLGIAIMSGSGHVAIGKDTANTNLDVNGSLLVSGSITSTGNLSTYDATMIHAIVNSGGNATNPIIYVNGDTNTGFYFPTTGKISLSNAGTNTVNITSTGVGIGNGGPSFPLEVTTNTATTVSVASFHNLDYTVGTKTFIRVRTQTSAVSSYSSYFGTGQDGTLHIVANDFARGGDIKINPFTGNITTSGTINGLSIPNDLFAQQFLLMGA